MKNKPREAGNSVEFIPEKIDESRDTDPKIFIIILLLVYLASYLLFAKFYFV